MPQKIQLRRGTSAQWTAANPTLAQGEAGFETDTDKLKFGDGTKPWNGLDYFTTDPALPLAVTQAVAKANSAVQPNTAPLLSGLQVGGTAQFGGTTYLTGPIDLSPDEPITQDGNDISGTILTIGADGILTPLTLPAGQSIRRKADGTAFEAYSIPLAIYTTGLINENRLDEGIGRQVGNARREKGLPTNLIVFPEGGGPTAQFGNLARQVARIITMLARLATTTLAGF